MLWFCVGTAGELIKIYPLIRRASERSIPWFALSTGQSAINFWSQWDDFRLPRERCGTLLETKQDLNNSSAALKWFVRANATSRRRLVRDIERISGTQPSKTDFWVVHGDTLSTLVGARYARKLGVPLVHIEAGLRSPDLFKPFPEEINRRIVSRFTRFHFTQDLKATENLKRARVRGKVVCTQGNTLMDALRYVMSDFPAPELPPKPYVVANVHRFENLNSSTRWVKMVETLERSARKQPVLLVQHPPTMDKLENEPSTRKRLQDAGVQLLPRMPFTHFVHLLEGADYVISDGGSNQEECYYLGMPCLLLRDSTERIEGLDGPCRLTRFDPELISEFLEDAAKYRAEPVFLKTRPVDHVLDTLYGPAEAQA